MGRRIQECLQALGKFAALRYELDERVGVGPKKNGAGADVLAEIGSEKITRQALDQYIEKMDDSQLARMAPLVSPETLKKQKEAVLKQYSTDENRRRILTDFLARELLYRKAREDGLADDPGVRALLQQSEREILAEQALMRALAKRIHITPEDVRTFYDANRDRFAEPAAARVAQIVVADAEKAKAVRNSLAAGRDFAELAAEVSEDESTAKTGGRIEGWITAQDTAIPGVGKCPAFLEAVFATKPGDVAAVDVATPAGVRVIKVLERREARQKPFAEVREDAYRQLRARKEREVRELLMKELRDRYDVVLHTDRLDRKPEPRKPRKPAASAGP
jgi:parvulin-like peptidyl-prolyl isomerase